MFINNIFILFYCFGAYELMDAKSDSLGINYLRLQNSQERESTTTEVTTFCKVENYAHVLVFTLAMNVLSLIVVL